MCLWRQSIYIQLSEAHSLESEIKWLFWKYFILKAFEWQMI